MAAVGADLELIGTKIAGLVYTLTGEVNVYYEVGTDEAGNSTTRIALNSAAGYSLTTDIYPVYNTSLQRGDTLTIVSRYKMDYITPLASLFGDTLNIETRNYTRVETPPE